MLQDGQRVDDGHKRDRVHRVDRACARGRQQQAAQRRAADGCDLADQRVQADGVGQMLIRHQIGHQRLERGRGKGRRRRQRRGQHVDGAHGDVAGQAQRGEDGREQCSHHVGPDQQLAPIGDVGHVAADDGEDHDGDDAGQAHAAQPQRLGVEVEGASEQVNGRVGPVQQLVDLPVNGDQLHLRAQDGDEIAQPDQPEVSVLESDPACAR